MNNVAIYVRVSSEDQQERGTIEAQIDFGTKYADLHQLNIVDWYKDDGVSGTIPIEERPESARMLEDAKVKKFDTILVYKLDRLGRSARIILNAVHGFEQLGIKVKSMTEPFDTGDPSGRFLLTILAGVADLERSTILDRMWHGANRAARNGKWLGGVVPYGYIINDEKFLEISNSPIPGMNMSEADVVRLIYRLTVEQHMSTIKIADYLNAVGIPPKYTISGRKIGKGKRKENTAGIWRPARVRNMIVNKTYMGIHEYGKRTKKKREIITREVSSIISQEIWDKAQQVLADNRLEASRNTHRKYLLRGLIKCGICGLNYIGNTFPTYPSGSKAYYICNGKKAYRGPKMGKCTAKNIPAEYIENIVWQDCLNFINNPGEALTEIDKNFEEKKTKIDSTKADIDRLKSALEQKDNEKQPILDLLRKKLIDDKDVETQFAKIAAEKESIKASIREIAATINNKESLQHKFDTAEQLLASLREKIKDGNPSFETKREIVKSLVEEILVLADDNVNNKKQVTLAIKYTFSDVVLRTDRGSSRQST